MNNRAHKLSRKAFAVFPWTTFGPEEYDMFSDYVVI